MGAPADLRREDRGAGEGFSAAEKQQIIGNAFRMPVVADRQSGSLRDGAEGYGKGDKFLQHGAEPRPVRVSVGSGDMQGLPVFRGDANA